MTIRKTLLVAFVAVGLCSAAILAGSAFVEARLALQEEIRSSLGAQARSVAAQVDKMTFERLQNAATWSRLSIMQDLQVRDVDKRLSRFLADLTVGYGDVYMSLSCLDLEGTVVSSSEPRNVGTRIATSAPSSSTGLAGAMIGVHWSDHAAGPALAMSVPLPAEFKDGWLGTLHLQLDWARFLDVLNEAAAGDGRIVALLDDQGRLVGVSTDARSRAPLMSDVLANWRAAPGSLVVRPGAPLVDSDVIVASAVSRGYSRFPGFGWTTLVIQPVDRAFAPIHRMALTFVGLFALILVFTAITAYWVSRGIAAPIVALTMFTRGYLQHRALGASPPTGAGEVGELSRAFVSMIRDIAQSQQNLVQASKLAVVGEMSAAIAHEVRTPLGILKSSAQMLGRERNISVQGIELVGFIESETERLNRLVSAMLDTARPREMELKPTDINELVRRSVAMLAAQAEAKHITVRTQARASKATISCDPEQMTQVMLNILLNALQVVPEGGGIDVTTDDADGAHLWIDIADDGPGIPAADRAKVFEAFFFKREGGVGLGLAIVQQIVVAHGGRIEVHESAKGGALFRILMPRER